MIPWILNVNFAYNVFNISSCSPSWSTTIPHLTFPVLLTHKYWFLLDLGSGSLRALYRRSLTLLPITKAQSRKRIPYLKLDQSPTSHFYSLEFSPARHVLVFSGTEFFNTVNYLPPVTFPSHESTDDVSDSDSEFDLHRIFETGHNPHNINPDLFSLEFRWKKIQFYGLHSPVEFSETNTYKYDHNCLFALDKIITSASDTSPLPLKQRILFASTCCHDSYSNRFQFYSAQTQCNNRLFQNMRA